MSLRLCTCCNVARARVLGCGSSYSALLLHKQYAQVAPDVPTSERPIPPLPLSSRQGQLRLKPAKLINFKVSNSATTSGLSSASSRKPGKRKPTSGKNGDVVSAATPKVALPQGNAAKALDQARKGADLNAANMIKRVISSLGARDVSEGAARSGSAPSPKWTANDIMKTVDEAIGGQLKLSNRHTGGKRSPPRQLRKLRRQVAARVSKELHARQDVDPVKGEVAGTALVVGSGKSAMPSAPLSSSKAYATSENKSDVDAARRSSDVQLRKAKSGQNTIMPGAQTKPVADSRLSPSPAQGSLGSTSTAWVAETWEVGWGEDKLAPQGGPLGSPRTPTRSRLSSVSPRPFSSPDIQYPRRSPPLSSDEAAAQRYIKEMKDRMAPMERVLQQPSLELEAREKSLGHILSAQEAAIEASGSEQFEDPQTDVRGGVTQSAEGSSEPYETEASVVTQTAEDSSATLKGVITVKNGLRKTARSKPLEPSKKPPGKTLAPVEDSTSELAVDPIESVTEGQITPEAVAIEKVEPPYEAEVPRLAHGLDRALFNPVVHWLQDPHSRVFNFEPYLQTIPRPSDFAYNRLGAFIPAARDNELWSLAEKHDKLYIGSTSGLTGLLSHIYWLISRWREVDTHTLSQDFSTEPRTFGYGSRTPVSVFLRYREGRYAVDPDKTYDLSGKASSILSDLGVLMEKLLTLEPETFSSLLKENPEVPGKFNKREAYHYSTSSKFLMRSQLDCYDPRLPGTGYFDLKTRGAVAIRHDRLNYVENSGYRIKSTHGLFESFEREYYDMMRSAFLKYSLQVRIGNMDGIFVAYHNTSQIFGFQYISLEEMDQRLFGGSDMGDAAFKLSLRLLENIFDQAIACFPAQTLRITFETKENLHTMQAWVEPDDWDEVTHGPRPIVQLDVVCDSYLDDEPVQRSVQFESVRKGDQPVQWLMNYKIMQSSRHALVMADSVKALEAARLRQQLIQELVLPNGVEEEEMLAKFDTMDIADIINARQIPASVEDGPSEHDAPNEEDKGELPSLNALETKEAANEDGWHVEQAARQLLAPRFRQPHALVRRLRRMSVLGAKESKRLADLESGKEKVVWRPGP